MERTHEMELSLLKLPTSERLALIEWLQQSVDDEVNAASESLTEKLQIAEMEQRLADFETGLVPSRAWPEIEAELRAEFRL